MASKNDIDILSFSETWFNLIVSNASIEIEGYRVYRLDCIGKPEVASVPKSRTI